MRKLVLYRGLAGMFGGAIVSGAALGILPGKAGAQAIPGAAIEVAAAKLFRVEVPGTNTDLLEKVRAFDPGAFVRRGEGVIQAGLFTESSEAKRLVSDLEFVGIPARLVKLKNKDRTPRSVDGQRFRVEVPGTGADLLARARAFEPGAFVRRGEGVIQMGLFEEAVEANRLIDELAIVGIRGQLVALEGAPITTVGDTSARQRLQVEVNGTDAGLLERVRTLEPGAFVRRGEGTIQVGQFDDATNAQQLIENLALLGVPAQVVAVKRPTANSVTPAAPTTNPDGTIAPGTELVFVPLELPDENRPIDVPIPPGGSTTTTLAPPPPLSSQQGEFYVVVPGRRRKLARIETKVRRGLNAPSIPVTLRNAPFGPHVAVGPFVRREEAEQWQTRLRSEGIKKARVEHLAR